MEPEIVEPTIAAIGRWAGVSLPNAAARRGLADMQALIAEFEALHAQMVFEDEPASFTAALAELAEPGT
jgi:hypothetical protein